MSADPIVAAARRLARALLKNTGYCPDIEFIGVRSSKTSCNTIATENGFDIRIDKNRGRQGLPDAVQLIARTYHAAAHMLCIQAGVSSHSDGGRHTEAFDLALIELGAPDTVRLEDFTKSQQAAAEAFAKALIGRVRRRPAVEKTAYERATVACTDPSCKHTITLRRSAIVKTRFLCVKHGEEMKVAGA